MGTKLATRHLLCYIVLFFCPAILKVYPHFTIAFLSVFLIVFVINIYGNHYTLRMST